MHLNSPVISYYETGRDQGTEAAVQVGRKEGYSLGHEKGVQIGKEVGFYSAISELWDKVLTQDAEQFNKR
jgi:flagellar biosynthesis/type III secretory pathway protein FliH